MSKLYEECPSCNSSPPATGCRVCQNRGFVETGLTTGQFDLYRRKAADAHEQGQIKATVRWSYWKDGIEYVGTCGKTLVEALDQIQRECKAMREAQGIGEALPTN